jgi:hypothetical protein
VAEQEVVARHHRPGLVLQPGDKMRMCTGNPATQSMARRRPRPTAENYFLFLPKTYVGAAGTVLTLVLRGLPVSKAEYDPSARRRRRCRRWRDARTTRPARSARSAAAVRPQQPRRDVRIAERQMIPRHVQVRGNTAR